jgi:ketosteroid isomerase-like protein
MIVLLTLLCGPAHGADDAAELARLLNEFLAGASVNDAAAHERFWADDLVYTSSGGERFGKQAILDELRAEDAGTAEPAVVYSAEDVRIRLYDDMAVVAFRLLGTAQGEPAEVAQYLNTGTFQKREGEWKAVAWQATRIPQAH